MLPAASFGIAISDLLKYRRSYAGTNQMQQHIVIIERIEQINLVLFSFL